jgi:hypothetical protein
MTQPKPATSREGLLRDAALMLAHHPDWRVGQAVFNTAMAWAGERANALRGSSVDPFYDDEKVNAFLDALFAGVSS